MMEDSVGEVAAEVVSDSSPPSKKPKMKQASLFDVLKPKALPPQATSLKPQKPQILSPISGNNKKRKSIDLSQGCQRGATKIAKTEETSTKGKRIKVNDGENEVSSSSEPETKNVPVAIKENVPDAKQPKITGSLDRFLRTTQAREVSTTGAEDTVDLTDDNSKEATAEEKVQPDSSQDSREQDKEVAVSVEETSDKPTEATEDKATEKETSKPDNKVASDEKPEVEAKIKSPTAESEPKSTPATPKTPATRPPRKAVKSSSKKEELERERKRLREEKEKQKQQEKEEKQRQRDAAKAERDRQKKEEKERKEKERAEQKLARDKEKQEKLEQLQKEKLEKQKKKQAEIDAKNEEKRKKEEDKKKEEEGKKRVEEEKLAKEKQHQQKFKSFFKPVEKKQPAPASKVEDCSGRFRAFQVKENMRLAPGARAAMTSQRRDALDSALQNQSTESYLLDLKDGKETGKSVKTWPSEDADVLCVAVEKDAASTARCMKVKLLQFRENYRPAYYGTWRKRSRKVTARRPLAQDSDMLDYEVDSDDEWEEEEPGESLSHSEKEDEEGEAADSDDEEDDGFFVPHGYLSDDEGCEEDEEDNTPERMKARQLAKAKAFELEQKKQTRAMTVLVVGPLWWNPATSGASSDPNYCRLAEFRVQPLGGASFPLDVSSGDAADAEKEPKGKKVKSEDKAKTIQFHPVPDEAMPDLVRLLHGNSAGMRNLTKEFREFWRLKTAAPEEAEDTRAHPDGAEPAAAENGETPMEVDPQQQTPDRKKTNLSETTPTNGVNISKRQMERKIKSIAVYEKREPNKKACWYVNQPVLEQYGLTELPVPCEWEWITCPNATPRAEGTPKSGRGTPTTAVTGTPPCAHAISKFTVKMTPEEMAALMPKPEPKMAQPATPPPPAKPNIQQFTVKMTPEQLAQQMPKPEPKPQPAALPPQQPAAPPRASIQKFMYIDRQAAPATVAPSAGMTATVARPSATPATAVLSGATAAQSTSSPIPTVQHNGTDNPLRQMLARTVASGKGKKKGQLASVSTLPKSVFEQKDGAMPSTSGAITQPMSAFEKIVIGSRQAFYQKKEADSTSDVVKVCDGDDDCMIVDEEPPTLPLVAPKGQPTLSSLFKKPGPK